VEVVVPVYNEQHVLEPSIRRLHGYLTTQFPFRFRITIADNASTDGTWPLATALQAELTGVRAVHLDRKGRGLALRQVWQHSDAEILSYMDVDLSTGLDAFLPLVAPLLSGHSDLAIGSRLHRSAAVVRGPKRELVSRGYNLLLRTTMAAGFTDAQCGFKAVRRDAAHNLLALVEDDAWFFDTELLVLAERAGMRIHEVPVDWVDDPDSRVDILRTAVDDLKGMARISHRMRSGAVNLPIPERLRQPRLPGGLRRQLLGFAAIGAVSTAAHLLLFLMLRQFLPALAANALALAATAVANTSANRRFTFGVTGRRDALRHQLQGGVAFLIGLALSTGALAALHAAVPRPTGSTEALLLLGTNALATAVRFGLLRGWVFNPRRGTA
jgi:putative flippase GtrA